MLSSPPPLGNGAIFASSGLDGPTDSRARFVGVLHSVQFDADGLLRRVGVGFFPRSGRSLWITFPNGIHLTTALNDLVAGSEADGRAVGLGYDEWHTLVADIPEDAVVTFSSPEHADPVAIADGETRADGAALDTVVLCRSGRRLTVSYGYSDTQAIDRATLGMRASLDDISQRVKGWYHRLPQTGDPDLDQLLTKCVSVMRVNTLAAGDVMPTMWSTPDRVPHRHMWLWDSVFHSFGMNEIDPEVAADFLRAVLRTQRPDGMIPLAEKVEGQPENITQPPVLAWGVWRNYEHTGDRQMLIDALPVLDRYLRWFTTDRRDQDTGLMTWQLRDDPNCRSDESGMDNSPRFDEDVAASVDLNTFAANDMNHLARIAAELGERELHRLWSDTASEVSLRTHELLWDEDAGFYFDRRADGTLSDIRAVSGFLPLLLDDLPTSRVDRLGRALEDPSDFGTRIPIPSVSRSDPRWSTDMWRGPVWVNLNYVVATGLRERGRPDLADTVRDATIDLVGRYYRTHGVIFEFYDADDVTSPDRADRKGPARPVYDFEAKIDSIRDYHWSAALTLALTLSRVGAPAVTGTR